MPLTHQVAPLVNTRIRSDHVRDWSVSGFLRRASVIVTKYLLVHHQSVVLPSGQWIRR